MTSPVRTLHVCAADDPAAFDDQALAREADALAVDSVHTVEAALDRLTTATFDCVLSQYRLPDGDGVTFLRHIRDFDSDLPFVLYADDGSERVASEAISAGVTDYVRTDPATDQAAAVADRIRECVDDQSSDSEAMVREVTEATEDVLWLIDGDWEEVLYVNSAYSTVWGQPESELRADPTAFFDAVHPEDRPRVEEALGRLDDGEPIDVELRVDPTADFQRRVSVQAEPIFDRDGDVKRVAGISREVTEQRARQRELAAEQGLTESIFEALPDVLYTFDCDGYLLRWNDQLETETGYHGGDLEEMFVTDFVTDDEVQNVTDSFRTVVEDRETVTVTSVLETKDGDRVPFEFTAAPLEDADGGLRGVTGVGRNIAERKRQQRRFEAVFNNTYQFTGLMTPDGTILEANSAAQEFAGLARDELVGESLWDAYWFQVSEEARRTARQAVETASDGEFFREQVTVQGAEREAVIDFSVRPVTDESGRVELLIPEGRDITRLSERERQLNVTSRFLRHNIRNKLTVIEGHAKLVAEGEREDLESLGEEIFAAAVDMEETAEMARKIHNLIENDPTPGRVDLVEQVECAAATTEERRSRADVTVTGPESVAVQGLASLDDALAELFETLLSNAESDNRTVTVDVTAADPAVVEVPVVDGGLPAADRDVLTGDIDIKQIRHSRGLGVWYVFWNVWYSGGTVTIPEDGDCIRVELPAA